MIAEINPGSDIGRQSDEKHFLLTELTYQTNSSAFRKKILSGS